MVWVLRRPVVMSNPWEKFFGLKRDGGGHLLDDGGAIMGDFRDWSTEARPVREAALVSCLNALDGRGELLPSIGSNPLIAVNRIAQGCPEAHLIAFAATQLERRGHQEFADTLRALAQHRSKEQSQSATDAAWAKIRAGRVARRVAAEAESEFADGDAGETS